MACTAKVANLQYTVRTTLCIIVMEELRLTLLA